MFVAGVCVCGVVCVCVCVVCVGGAPMLDLFAGGLGWGEGGTPAVAGVLGKGDPDSSYDLCYSMVL